jgi:ketosteroid isomerase-like protein
MDAVATIEAANRAFYEAFETSDLDAMSDLWEHSDRATCTHPGWATLRGWGRVSASFFALFQGQSPQFVLTQQRVEVLGDLAWVSVDENLLGVHGGATVAATNLFYRRPGEEAWKMVCHHGSVVTTSQAPGTDEPGGDGAGDGEPGGV